MARADGRTNAAGLSGAIFGEGAVSYRTYSDAGHEGVLTMAQADIEAWVDARFAGVKATSNCNEPPSDKASR
jgi:hypothetical protein